MFCSMYLRGIETRWSREEKNVDGYLKKTKQGLDVFFQRVRPLGAAKYVNLIRTFLQGLDGTMVCCNDLDGQIN
jgi:hypothetical protein